MDQIREAFQKVRDNINNLTYEIDSLKISLAEVNWRLSILTDEIKSFVFQHSNQPQDSHFTGQSIPTHIPQIPTHPTHSSTDNFHFKPQKAQNWVISTGNEGVPTDRQTDQQTDRHTRIPPFIQEKTNPIQSKNSLANASEIINSLNSLKKEIRLKFKRLTEREILVFSTLYQLDEERGFADYKSLAQKLNLTESSIRDYVGRLIVKGIPVDKTKLNNKNIQLNIPEALKQTASLSTILQLRDL